MSHQDVFLRAEDEAFDLLSDCLLTCPPPKRLFRLDALRKSLPLGGYLLALGYATPRQIVTAIRVQRQQIAQGNPSQLGDILIAQEVIQPQPLTAVLLVQLVERVIMWRTASPQRLGEHLIVTGVLSPLQLAPAIKEQICLRQVGKHMRLGELLVQQGILDQHLLQSVLDTQQFNSERQQIIGVS